MADLALVNDARGTASIPTSFCRCKGCSEAHFAALLPESYLPLGRLGRCERLLWLVLHVQTLSDGVASMCTSFWSCARYSKALFAVPPFPWYLPALTWEGSTRWLSIKRHAERRLRAPSTLCTKRNASRGCYNLSVWSRAVIHTTYTSFTTYMLHTQPFQENKNASCAS